MQVMMSALDIQPFRRRLGKRLQANQPTAPAKPNTLGQFTSPHTAGQNYTDGIAPSHQHPTPLALENQPSPNPTNTSSQPGFKAKRCHYTSNPRKRRHSSYLYPLSRFLSTIG